MTPEDAMRMFNRKYSKLKITSMFDRKEYYILTAVENPNETDYNAPFYAVHKKTGQVTNYTPLADFDEFAKAMGKGDLRKSGTR